MKVLFVLEDYLIDPLGIGYLASWIKSLHHEADLINYEAEDIYAKLNSYRPDIVAYSITTGRHKRFRELNEQIKSYCTSHLNYTPFSLFGGPHCTFYPQFVNSSDAIDAICIGEGYDTFQVLLESLSTNKLIDDVPNIRTHTQGYGDLAPLVNMDLMPLPDRHLLYKYQKNQENPIRSIIASFQCGLHCSYCVHEDTIILRIDGTTTEIKNLNIGDIVVGLTQKGTQWFCTSSIIENIWKTYKQAYKIVCEDGTEVICSGDHKWLTSKHQWEHIGSSPDNFNIMSITGNTIAHSKKVIRYIPIDGTIPMYDITTSTENFIANGLVSHNCYAPKYREVYELGSGFKNISARSPQLVCEEARQVRKEFKTHLFYFQDDVFPVWRKHWVDEFCKYWDNGPFHIQIRVEMIHEDIIEKLKSVGLHGITFAVESGVEKVRKEILKRNMSNAQIIEGAKILRKHGIKFRMENMMGTLGESYTDTLETLKLNIQCKPDLAWSSLWQPYPGTELGDKAIEMGLFDPTSDNIGFDFFHDSILLGQDANRIKNLQKLFGITVRYPFLLPITKILCKLPPNRIFDAIYSHYKKWAYEHRLYKVKPHLRGSKQMEEK